MSDFPLARGIRATSFFGAVVAILLAGASAAQDAYRLNIGDRVALRFVQWDTIKLAFVEFDAVNGTYIVEPDGTIMMPLVGTVDMAGRALTEIADSMAVDLQSRLGLVEPPGASLSVVGHRPVYVLGAVAAPGAYDFSPGLTVQQALALAGGVETLLDEGPDGEAAAVRAAGTLQEIAIDIVRQEVRAARLRAEMDGDSDFQAPDGVTHPDGPEALNAITERERRLFEGRREAKARALDALDDSQSLLETEIEALQDKLAGQSRQVDMLRQSVGNMEALFERGLVRSPNLVSLQGQLLNLENSQRDTETAIFRARQAIAELERERIEIEAERRLEVLRELQRSEATIERLLTQRDTTRRLLLGVEALLATSERELDIQISYRITRPGAEGPQTLDAGPDTRLGPSDVVEVEAILDPAGN